MSNVTHTKFAFGANFAFGSPDCPPVQSQPSTLGTPQPIRHLAEGIAFTREIGMEDGQAVPLSAVPTLIQILGERTHPNFDEALSLLCDLVGNSYGKDGVAVGEAMRENNGIATISWLLSEPDPEILEQVLFLVANLASDAVDLRSSESKLLY